MDSFHENLTSDVWNNKSGLDWMWSYFILLKIYDLAPEMLTLN